LKRNTVPRTVEARELRKGDRLWFQFQGPGKDYITNTWGYGDEIMVQCDSKFSSRKYQADEDVKIHPRKRKKVKKK